VNPFSRNALDQRAAEGTAGFYLGKERQYGPDGQAHVPFLRYVVLDVVYDPAAIDQAAIDRFEHELGVSNVRLARGLPRNSVVARRVLDGTSSAEPPMFLLPFFPPHLAMPCKPGEHVWVMFESPLKRADVGFWVCRISEPHFVDDVNHTHAPRAYDPAFEPTATSQFEGSGPAPHEFRNGRPEEAGDGTRYTVAESATLVGDDRAYERLLTESPASMLVAYGPVPRHRKRPGDLVLEGSHNALLSLGTDRTGPVADAGQLPETDLRGMGAIDIVAGRGQTQRTGGRQVENSLGRNELAKDRSSLEPAEGDPDLQADRARVYVAQGSRVDRNFGLVGLSGAFEGVKDSDGGDSCVVVSADKVRIIARADVEVVTTGFEVDDRGLPKRIEDDARHAAVVLKSNGDIVLRPGSQGAVKIGADDAPQHVVLGDELLSYLQKITATFNSHMHAGETVAAAPPTAPGPPLPITPSPPSSSMDAPTAGLLSDIALTKKSL
jgi:hypothetical protein